MNCLYAAKRMFLLVIVILSPHYEPYQKNSMESMTFYDINVEFLSSTRWNLQETPNEQVMTCHENVMTETKDIMTCHDIC